jgi:hypothetical protein
VVARYRLKLLIINLTKSLRIIHSKTKKMRKLLVVWWRKHPWRSRCKKLISQIRSVKREFLVTKSTILKELPVTKTTIHKREETVTQWPAHTYLMDLTLTNQQQLHTQLPIQPTQLTLQDIQRAPLLRVKICLQHITQIQIHLHLLNIPKLLQSTLQRRLIHPQQHKIHCLKTLRQWRTAPITDRRTIVKTFHMATIQRAIITITNRGAIIITIIMTIMDIMNLAIMLIINIVPTTMLTSWRWITSTLLINRNMVTSLMNGYRRAITRSYLKKVKTTTIITRKISLTRQSR